MGLLLKNLVKKSLTLKEFHIFFRSTPIEILNFYGLSEEFFFLVQILNAIGHYGQPSRFLHCKESILN